jgi:hypothetical protein
MFDSPADVHRDDAVMTCCDSSFADSMLCSCCSHDMFATSKGYVNLLEAEQTRRDTLEVACHTKRKAAAAKKAATAAAKTARKAAAADRAAAKPVTRAAAAAGTANY